MGNEKKELLLFLGFSRDARAEAKAIKELREELQRFLRLQLIGEKSPISHLNIFLWQEDVRIESGGEVSDLDPHLIQADIATFIFKEQIGEATKRGFNYYRKGGVPIITAFPKKISSDKTANIQGARAWLKLLEFREDLTKNQKKANKDAIVLCPLYKDIEHLKKVLKPRIERLITAIITKSIREIQKEVRPQISFSGIDVEMELDASYPSYSFLDALSSDAQFDPKIVSRYQSLLRKEDKIYFSDCATPDAFLEKAGFLRNGKLTNTGALLFTEKPSAVVPSAVFKVIKYAGKTKNSKKIQKTLQGPVFEQINKSWDFIKDHIDSHELIINSAVRPEIIYQYPMKCLREAIRNAFCHRDYEDKKKGGFINIFSDRIEILNPARGIFGAQKLEDNVNYPLSSLKTNATFSKNMNLASAMSSINIMELAGSGIEKALKDCRQVRAPEPIVRSWDGYIYVTIYPRENWEEVRKREKCSEVKADTHYVLAIGQTGAGKTTVNGLIMHFLSKLYSVNTDPVENIEGDALFKKIGNDFASLGSFPAPTPAGKITEMRLAINRKNNSTIDLSFLEISGKDLAEIGRGELDTTISKYFTCPTKSITLLLVADLKTLLDGSTPEKPDDFFQTFLSFLYRLREKGVRQKNLQKIVLLFSKSDAVSKAIDFYQLAHKKMPKTYLHLSDGGRKAAILPISVGVVKVDESGEEFVDTLDYTGPVKSVVKDLLDFWNPPKRLRSKWRSGNWKVWKNNK